MFQLPEKLLQSLNGIKGFELPQFIAAHHTAVPVTSIRINTAKTSADTLFPQLNTGFEKIPWCNDGYYLNERPSFTFDPLFHAGYYYVQEASSMFLQYVLEQAIDLKEPLKVLDLCAAPGGKTTLLQSVLHNDSLLVANEVIKNRSHVLTDNIIKWGCANVMVTQNDPAVFARVPDFFDVIVVDAPCSGSGLFRRDEDATDEWSEGNVMLCSKRQQRILADVLPALKPGGLLIYSTCSFSETENEQIADWATAELHLKPVNIEVPENYGITVVSTPQGNQGLRFWPHLLKGEGFYLSVFKKDAPNETVGKRKKNDIRPRTTILTGSEKLLVNQWLGTDVKNLIFHKHNNIVYAWPEKNYADMAMLLTQLKVIYSGIETGELMRNKIVPHHALALSTTILQNPGSQIQQWCLTKEQAIMYLQKKEMEVTVSQGWKLVTYNGAAIGWANVLPNRVNNYYPKEMRILKEL